MTEKVKLKKIKPAENYGAMKDNDVHTLGETVTENLMAHTATFPNPPVDPKTLKTDNDNFGAGIIAAQDGGKTAIAQKDKLRQIVIKDLRLIGRYVEETANGDVSTFALSGLRPISGTRTARVPLSPHFRNIKHGKLNGQIVIQFKAVPGALSYELHSAAMTNGMPGQWTSQLVTSVRTPVTLSGLTPGTLYAFQARVMDKAGYSDWSDPITFMCT